MPLSIIPRRFKLGNKDKEKHKILFLSNDNYLTDVSIRSGASKRLFRHELKLNFGCSFSPLVQNRFAYLVGGRSLDVYYYDLADGVLHPGPPLSFEIWHPKLLLLGSKLFAFSNFSPSMPTPSKPTALFLDTASDSREWFPLQTYPELPNPRPRDIACYHIQAYAINSNDDLFVSLGSGINSFAHCYNDSEQKWSNFSQTALPFYGQGQFVGLCCYAFPKVYHRIDNSEYLVAYHLTIDWKTDAKVCCVEMCRYSLLSNSPYHYTPSYMHSFFPKDQHPNIFTIVRAKVYRTSDSVKKHKLDIDVVQLSSPPPPLPIEFQPLPSPLEQEFPIQVSLESSSYAGNSGLGSVSAPYLQPLVEFQPLPSPLELESSSPGPLSTLVLKHKSIPLPHALEEIFGEYIYDATY